MFDTFIGIFRENNFELAARIETQTAMRLRQAATLMQKPEEVMARLEKAFLLGF